MSDAAVSGNSDYSKVDYEVEVEQTRRTKVIVHATDAMAAENIVDEMIRCGRIDIPGQPWAVDHEGIVHIGGREVPEMTDTKPGPPQAPLDPTRRHA